MFSLFLLFILLTFSSSESLGQGIPRTYTFTIGTRTLIVEVNEFIPSTNKDVVWYFHGGGGSQTNWRQQPVTKEVRKNWRTRGKQPPTVVAISFGPTWYFNRKLLKLFVNGIMPFVENNLISQVSGRRKILGISMGGFNGLQSILFYPKKFDGAALICPALADIELHNNPLQSMWRYKIRTNAIFRRVAQFRQSILPSFPTRQSWLRSIPSRVAPNLISPNTPLTLLSPNKKDNFGFYTGAEDYMKLAAAKGARMVWSPKNDFHCEKQDGNEIGEFLVP